MILPLMPLPEPDFAAQIAAELGVARPGVEAVIALLDQGCTVPFIARYRKEATGGAVDETISRTQERLEFHRELHARKAVILESIHSQGKLTPELRAAIEKAQTRTVLEDLYLPYRPKRRTRATMAKEKGLEPLADRMWMQEEKAGDRRAIAQAFVDPEKKVHSAEEALQGARDILAERIVENAAWRALVRRLTWEQGRMVSKAARGKADVKSKFTDYYDFSEPVARIPSHRLLAILRGENEGFLTSHIAPDPDVAKNLLVKQALRRPDSIWKDDVREAAEDGYERLLGPQLETEIRAELKAKADATAIDVFASNLADLLMAPPFGAKPVMAIDPGLRTGCKVVILDATGELLEHGVVYPTLPREDLAGTEKALDVWFAKYADIGAVAVGNGTGGRETLAVVLRYLATRHRQAVAVSVNESGASVYSASEIARNELPDHDVTVRGAASIGRRLQDPLSELVKIDPKSIGVGQYQHDVDQKLLKQRLDQVVISCVNRVGVDANTASASLLSYVSGIGAKMARSIVEFRNRSAGFRSRQDFQKVPGLGAKTFEQAAGFLRVKGPNPLDDSAVHPERYELVERIAADRGLPVSRLIGNQAAIRAIDIARYVDDTVGRYTLEDIIQELEKPGRDPRQNFEVVAFREDVQEIDDLQAGMILQGIVTNVTHFGAFVDVGVHQDGLVHVSQIADRFVRDPSEVLRVGQKVRVKVLEVDLQRRRIGLSIREVGGDSV